MLTMHLRRSGGWWWITVDGFPTKRYMFYTKREAVRRYRQEFGLVGKHMKRIEWG